MCAVLLGELNKSTIAQFNLQTVCVFALYRKTLAADDDDDDDNLYKTVFGNFLSLFVLFE